MMELAPHGGGTRVRHALVLRKDGDGRETPERDRGHHSCKSSMAHLTLPLTHPPASDAPMITYGWSFFKVEADRGSAVTYETIRQWCLTFGPSYARTLRRRRGRMGGGISTSCS
jgi:hypothetical protein